MQKHIIAIVGMPNAGKTTLFNRLLKEAAKNGDFIPAITDSTPGVTRDRNYGILKSGEREFVIIDTGGFMPDSHILDNRDINQQVREQAMLAIEEADLIVHLLDARAGITPSDQEMYEDIRASGKPCLSVVNKVDSRELEGDTLEFYQMGIDELIPVSAKIGYNIQSLISAIESTLPIASDAMTDEEQMPRVAVIGKPNTGKSTFINTLLGKKRLIVSPTPGTTRDSIDTVVQYYNRKYLFIDTAGIRKKSKATNIERYAMTRAERSIKRCDIALLIIDGLSGIVDQDQKVAGLLRDSGKGALLLINKWDKIEDPDSAFKDIERQIKDKLWFLDYAPFLTVSGLTKKRITKIFPVIDHTLLEMQKRVQTSELNNLLREHQGALQKIEETSRGLKILYMTQVSTSPPHFVLFINKLSSFKKHHLRFFERIIRDRYSFSGCPILISVQARRGRDDNRQ